MRLHHRDHRLAAILMAVALGLGACASQPAAYAPKAPGASTGYTDEQLTSDRYRVTFTGNSATERQRVEDYLLLRAAQVTVNAGHNWFLFDTRSTHAKTTYMSTFSGWPGWHGYGWYWHSWAWGPPYTATTRASTRYQAYAEIVFLTDEQASKEPRAVNAREIIQHLEPTAVPASRS